MRVLARAYDRGTALQLIKARVDFQIRETFESALVFGGETLAQLGVEQDEIAETLEDVRRRDAERLDLQIAGDIAGARGLLKGNVPVPAPLAPPRQPGRALNEETASVLARSESEERTVQERR